MKAKKEGPVYPPMGLQDDGSCWMPGESDTLRIYNSCYQELTNFEILQLQGREKDMISLSLDHRLILSFHSDKNPLDTIQRYLDTYEVKNIVFHFDNTKEARKTIQELGHAFKRQGYKVSVKLSQKKYWWQDLENIKNQFQNKPILEAAKTNFQGLVR